MSEQNPWGAPPPSNYGPPPGQYGSPYPNQPQGGPPPGPPGGGWNGPGGPGGPGGYGPPPKKRRLGLVLGIVIACLVVVAAVVATLLVTTGDDDDTADDPSPSPSTSETTETGTESPTEGTESPTDSPSTDAVVPDDAIEGNGYFYELPAAGWQDATQEAKDSNLGPTIDTISILGTSLSVAQSNVLVEALSSGAATDVDQLSGQWKRNLSGTDGAEPVDIPDRDIDGERAIGVEIVDRENANGVLITQVAYLVIRGDQQYSIALSYPSEGDVTSRDDFEKVLDSWSWTS